MSKLEENKNIFNKRVKDPNIGKEDIIFQIIGWDSYHDDDESSEGDPYETYHISLYGKTKDGQTLYVQVDNFNPYFFIKIPQEWNNDECRIFIKWLQKNVAGKYQNGKARVKGTDSSVMNSRTLLKWELIEKNDFWGFTNYKLFKFLKLTFLNHNGFKKYKWTLHRKLNLPKRLSQKKIRLKLYESNIDPMLRFMHEREIDSCGWVRVKAGDYKFLKGRLATSTCEYDIVTNWDNIYRDDNTNITKWIVASFDIECTSGDGSFPQAIRDSDKIIQIGTTFNYYGEDECFYKHIVTLGSCDPIEGVDVESYDTEQDVLIAWRNMIQKTNPDILTGYNIFGFDYRYLRDRAAKFNLSYDFAKLGRIKNDKSEFIEKDLSSAALGENKLYYYDMQGRIQVDLLKVIQRDHNLTSYKLDSVASNFIRGKIKKILFHSDDKNIPKNHTKILTGNTYGLDVGRYIKIFYNDGLSDTSYNDGQKFVITDMTKDSLTIKGILKDESIELDKYTIFWCQAKDDVEAKDIFRLQEGTSADRAIIAKYCIQDCMLCNKLMTKLQILTNNIGMANVCNVPLSYIFLRGQGIKIFSLVAKKCRIKNHLIPDAKKPKQKPDEKSNSDILTKDLTPEQKADQQSKLIAEARKKAQNFGNDDEDDEDDEDDDAGYEGAVVLDPEKGVHEIPIPVLDYASLYPRSMIHRNISHETLVLHDKTDETHFVRYSNVPGVKYDVVEFEDIKMDEKKKEIISRKPVKCIFAQPQNGKIGIVPEILMDLLGARSSTRVKQKSENDPFKWEVLEGLQLAYKITANSLYGQTGARTSSIYLRNIAASTTATGRYMLYSAKNFVENVFGSICKPVQDNDYDLFCKQLMELFTHNKMNGYQMFPGVKPTDDRFVDKKGRYDNKQSFIDYLWKELSKILIDRTVNPYCVYGDSVTGDTPLLIKSPNNIVSIIPIEQLNDKWEHYNGFKLDGEIRTNKQQNSKSFDDYKVWSDSGWTRIKRVIRHKCKKKIYRVVTNKGVVDVTEDHSLLSENGKILKPGECKIGTSLLHNCVDINNEVINWDINVKHDGTKHRDAEIYWSRKLQNKPVSIDNNGNISYETSERSNTIQNIILIGYTDDYVYDIETYSGRFGAGIGEIIVKNTDSVFINFDIRDKNTDNVLKCKDTLYRAIQLGVYCGYIINMILPYPHDLEYEKTFWPFVILSKKRYVGNLYVMDVEIYYQKSMGIVLKRRDNAPIVKIIVGGIVKKILDERDPKGAVDFASNELRNMLEGKYPISKYIITKTLKSTYVDRTRMAHVALADRMAERDPGNAPQSNDRIPIVYKVTHEKTKLQGDMVEHPDYIIEHGLEIDYLVYITNQIMKPAIQFLEHIIEDPEEIFKYWITREINRRKGIRPVEYYINMYNNSSGLDEYEQDDNDDENNLGSLLETYNMHDKNVKKIEQDKIKRNNRKKKKEITHVAKKVVSGNDELFTTYMFDIEDNQDVDSSELKKTRKKLISKKKEKEKESRQKKIEDIAKDGHSFNFGFGSSDDTSSNKTTTKWW